jgi:hypothetical protein
MFRMAMNNAFKPFGLLVVTGSSILRIITGAIDDK